MKKIDPLNLVIIGTIVLVVGIGGYLFYITIGSGLFSRSYVSPYVLNVSSPVFTFSGKVTNINDQFIWVTQEPVEANLQAPIEVRTGRVEPNTTNTPTPTQPVTLQLKLTSVTQVQTEPSSIPYLFGATNQSATDQVTTKPMIGDLVTVSTDKDIRTSKPNDIGAVSIRIFPKPNKLIGTVDSVQGNTIIINGTYDVKLARGVVPASQNTPVQYTINVGTDTQIGEPGSPAALNPGANDIHLGINDIKKGMNLTVYSDQDLTQTTTLNAKLVIVTPLNIGAIPATQANPVQPISQ